MNRLIVTYLIFITVLLYPVFLLLELAVPGAPLFIPVYCAVICLTIHAKVTGRKFLTLLFDGDGLYEQYRIANLVIVGLVFSAGVYLVRQALESRFQPDLNQSILVWQVLFGVIAVSAVPRIALDNNDILPSFRSIRLEPKILLVWLASILLILIVGHSFISLGIITIASALMYSGHVRQVSGDR